MNEWLKQAEKYFIDVYKLNKNFAVKVALLYAYFFYYNLNPRITSGYRSEEYNKKLLERYYAGDPTIIYKPTIKGTHSTVDKYGKPSAIAIDIQTNDHLLAAQIAEALKIRAGYRFGDPVHFYVNEL